MTCAKRVVKARLTLATGEEFYGDNWCAEPQEVCPRAIGEGYEKCVAVCKQPYHAEESAIQMAKAMGYNKFNGAHMIVNYPPCGRCLAMMWLFGIVWSVRQVND